MGFIESRHMLRALKTGSSDHTGDRKLRFYEEGDLSNSYNGHGGDVLPEHGACTVCSTCLLNLPCCLSAGQSVSPPWSRYILRRVVQYFQTDVVGRKSFYCAQEALYGNTALGVACSLRYLYLIAHPLACSVSAPVPLVCCLIVCPINLLRQPWLLMPLGSPSKPDVDICDCTRVMSQPIC